MDILARPGGDEFVVLLPETNPEECAGIVERLRAAVPEDQRSSAGIATFDPRESAESVLDRADAALYKAKRSGRDQVVSTAPHEDR